MPKVTTTTTRSSPRETPQLVRAPSSSQSTRSQQSILGFFQKKTDPPAPSANGQKSSSGGLPFTNRTSSKHARPAPKTNSSTQSITPAPSSDALESPKKELTNMALGGPDNGLLSPVTPMNEAAQSRKASRSSSAAVVTFSSPSRKVVMFY